MRRLAGWLVLAAALGSCLGGCRGGSNDATCGTVASRLFAIAREDLAKASVDPATRRAVADQLPAMRDALVQACSDGGWAAPVRNCMASATDHAGMQACQQQLTDDQRRALDRAARGETTSR
jgi:hypothetical protein